MKAIPLAIPVALTQVERRALGMLANSRKSEARMPNRWVKTKIQTASSGIWEMSAKAKTATTFDRLPFESA
jgi:hypothetical protein